MIRVLIHLSLLAVTTMPAMAQYCMLPGETPYSSLQPGITNFQLNTINRTSGNSESSSAVVVVTGVTTTLTAGQTYTISISHSEDTQFFAGARNNLRVWVDYNSNFSYLDAGETVLTVDLRPPATTYTATFTVPASTPAGTLNMRATAKMSVDAGHSLPTPCNVPADPLGYHGEMEDYKLVIVAAQGQAPQATFAVNSATVCRQGTISITNSSTGDPAPTFSWSATPAAGVTFTPSATSVSPVVKFTNQGNYSITCVATNSLGTHAAVKSVTVGSCILTTAGESKKDLFSFFPSPANDEVNFVFEAESSGTIRIAEATGRIIVSRDIISMKELTISTREFPNGIYIVRLTTSGNDTFTRFAVCH
jgi:hypothetical protein